MTLQEPTRNSFAAVRLQGQLLETIDAYCEQQDLTRSQFLRRSILNYLEQQKVEFVIEKKQRAKPQQPRLSFTQFVQQQEKDDRKEER